MTDTTKSPDILIDFSHPLKNGRHEKFCQLYVTNPMNIGAIYREAGYETKDMEHGRINAYKLLRMDSVRGRIDWLVDERNKRLGLDGDDVIRGLYMMRDRCAGGQIVRDRQGNPITEFADVDGQEKLCIVWRSDVTGFLRASELLAKYHGLLVERSENVNITIDKEELEQKADEVLKNFRYSQTIDQKTGKPKDKAKIDGVIPVSTENQIDDTKKSHVTVYNDKGKAVA